MSTTEIILLLRMSEFKGGYYTANNHPEYKAMERLRSLGFVDEQNVITGKGVGIVTRITDCCLWPPT